MSLDGKKKSSRDKTKVGGRYQLYGLRQSYFTQKMHAAFEWYLKDKFDFNAKGEENTEMLETRSGTHQIPVIITPENWCIADSTPMLALLDGRLREPRFYPKGLAGALSAVLKSILMSGQHVGVFIPDGERQKKPPNMPQCLWYQPETHRRNLQKKWPKMLFNGVEKRPKHLVSVRTFKSENVSLKLSGFFSL